MTVARSGSSGRSEWARRLSVRELDSIPASARRNFDLSMSCGGCTPNPRKESPPTVISLWPNRKNATAAPGPATATRKLILDDRREVWQLGALRMGQEIERKRTRFNSCVGEKELRPFDVLRRLHS